MMILIYSVMFSLSTIALDFCLAKLCITFHSTHNGWARSIEILTIVEVVWICDVNFSKSLYEFFPFLTLTLNTKEFLEARREEIANSVGHRGLGNEKLS